MKRKSYIKVNRFLALLIVLTMAISMMNSGWVYAYDKNDEVHLAAMAHIDTAWQWPFEDTVKNIIPDTFHRQINALKSNPNLKFTMSATSHLAWIKEYYPDMWKDIKKLVQQGQIDLVGGQVVEQDTNSTSGESLLRQGLVGQKFLQENFGKKATVGFLPDCFGFSGNYPQILQKTGMTSFSTSKLSWNDTNKFPYNLFQWKGIDGSQVLAYETTSNYDHQYTDSEILQMLDNLKSTGVRKAYGSFGSGDHGGGPELSGGSTNYQTVLDQDARMAPHVINSTPTQYFDSIRQDNLSKVPTWEGEMYLEYHRGTYTSWARQKAENRKSEITAEQAEKAGTIGKWLGVIPDNSEVINNAWSKILINQMHDIQPGSSVPMQYQVSFNMHEMARNQLNTVKTYGLQAMAYRADTSVQNGVPVFVFNPLSWTRNDLVETTLQFDTVPQYVRIYDQAGEEMPCEVLSTNGNSATVRFEAKEVPAVGYKIFRAEISSMPCTVDTGLSVDGNTIENKYYKIVINPATGNIFHIYNKKDNNRDILNGEGNELQIFKDTGGTSYPAWDLMRSEFSPSGGDPYEPTYKLNTAPDSIQVLESSREKAVIRVSRTWGNSSFEQDITMYPDIQRIDVKMHTNWQESNKMLKVSFPFSAVSNTATYEIAYGSLQRSTNRDTSFDGARFEQSGHKWADITNESDKAFGASILNDSKYGWDVYKYKDNSKTRLRLSLLRSARTASSAGYGYNDPGSYSAMDQGTHDFTYSIYPHAGDWTGAQTVQKAYELNYPVTAFQAHPHAGTLGNEFSFVNVAEPNVIVSVVKSPYGEPDSKDLIVRMYESQGKDATTAHISFPTAVKSAKEVNALEEDYAGAKPVSVSGSSISAGFGKYEIKTLRISLDAPEEETVAQNATTVDLYNDYNLDGASSDANRKDGNLDGSGNTYSADMWPAKVAFEGVLFNLGPVKDGYKNLVEAKGQTIPLPGGKYKYVYLLGAAAGTGKSSGTFTVNYYSGNSVQKDITFAQWNAEITGWDANARMDIRPVVKDAVAYDFTHYHQPSGDAWVKDNYLYVYKIPVETTELVKDITLPDAPGIKIAAISLANSDFLEKAQLVDPNEAGADMQPPSQVTGVNAQLVTGVDQPDQVVVTWNAATDNNQVAYYKVYRGVTGDFVPGAGNYLGLVTAGGTLKYTDTLGARNTYYYKVVAYDQAGNASTSSEASSPVAGGMDNAFITPGVTATASSSVSGEPPAMAIDGTVLNNSKWCANSGAPYWLKVDMGTQYSYWTISRFAVMHAEAGGEGASWNTKDFKIQTSNDGNNWTDQATVTGNVYGTTTHPLSAPLSARYYRLYVTAPTNNTDRAVRIYEFQALGTYSGPARAPSAKDVYINALKAQDQSLTLTGYYTFVPVDPSKVELSSQYRWYGETGDGNYSLIEGQSGRTLSLPHSTPYKSVIFEVIPSDATLTAGTAVKSVPIYIAPESVTDRVYKRPVTVSSQTGVNEAGSMAVDGDNKTKWCSTGARPQTLVVDMGAFYGISQFELRHSQSIGEYDPGNFDNNASLNTADYEIAMSRDGITWDAPVASLTGNTLAVTQHDVNPDVAIGRYVKLTIIKSNLSNNTAVRIYGFKALGKPRFDYSSPGGSTSEPTNVVATGVKIVGTPEVNKALTGSYTVDAQNEQFCKFRWLESDLPDGAYTPVFNANDKIYMPTKDLEGKFLKFEVRVGQGVPVASSPVQVRPQSAVNVLPGSSVTVNKEIPGNEGRLAVDGDSTTHWFAPENDNTLTCALNSVYIINNFVVKHAGSSELNTKDFEILVSENGEMWTKAASVQNNTGSISTINLAAPVRAKYVRLHVIASYNSLPSGSTGGTCINEFEAYGIPAGVTVPTATGVTISSQAETGKLLVASYRYDDPNGDWEGNSILQWVQGDEAAGTFTPVPGATTKFFRPAKELAGKYIKFTVVPVNKYGVQGVTSSSNVVQVQNAKPSAMDVMIAGDRSIHGKLTVSYTYSDIEDDPQGDTAFQWYRSEDGSIWTEIADASAKVLDLAEVPGLHPGITSVKCRITPKQADGWQGNAADSSTVTITPEGYNVLKGATATADQYVNSSESPDKLVDGDYTTKWCENTSANPKWWIGDMGSVRQISTFVLRNCKTREAGYANTAAFTILTSKDGDNWTKVKSYTGNTENITVYELSKPVYARYVKLTVDEPATARLYELEAWGTEPGTTLEIPDHPATLDCGEAFNVKYGVSVSSAVYSEDIEISYDMDLFAFEEATACDDDTSIQSVSEDVYGDGTAKVRISLNHTEDGILGNKAVLNLAFRAKTVSDTGNGTISVSKAALATISGEEVDADLASISLTVNGVKPALSRVIEAAQAKYDEAIVGVENGNYFRSTKEKLGREIALAEAVLASEDGDYMKAKQDLLTVLTEFEKSVITGSTGDLNGDGSFTEDDLADIIQYYGMNVADLQGAEKLADVDGDGEVGLTDLVFVAQKIENR